MKKVSFGDNSIFSNVYSGTADFGKTYAYIISAFAFVISVIAIIIGILLIKRKPVYTTKVEFIVTKVVAGTETERTPQGEGTVERTKTIYNLEGTVPMCGQRIFTLESYPTYVDVGQSITAWIKQACSSNEAHVSSDETRGIGWGIIIIAIIAIIFNILRLFLVRKYKGVAAVQGVSGASNLYKMFR